MMNRVLLRKGRGLVWADLALGFERLLPSDPQVRHDLRVAIFRIIGVVNIILGTYYLAYRYLDSINFNALWIAIPLLLAETYSVLDTILFILMMWKMRRRTSPPVRDNLSVDVFIATYNEDVDLVQQTAEAALRISYPHRTYVLDDGDRPEMRQACEEIGCEYITRGPEWEGKPRHAKAGNVNNALMRTDGEFVLILDADQVPMPTILDRVLGYFEDPEVAFVQTPQFFYNVPQGDPFGSQAPLFYGPIQQGKDGWNAAFFCGSNAVLRREALFSMGFIRYVQSTKEAVMGALSAVPVELHTDRKRFRRYRIAGQIIADAAEDAIRAIEQGEPLLMALDTFQDCLREAQRAVLVSELADMEVVLHKKAAGAPDEEQAEAQEQLQMLLESKDQFVDGMLENVPLSFSSLGLSDELERVINMELDEAFEIQPLVTFSITEDMATAMQLHALGWKSVFHPEILAVGLAPEDLASMLGQRFRWGAGTLQVLLADNPLVKQGLSIPQKLQYFTTMYSYFSGFVSVVYLVAPIIYLFTGIAPVDSYSGAFLWHLIPYLIMNKIMFQYLAWGLKVFRGEQYNLALFPVWIEMVFKVLGGAKLSFNVTSKSRQSGIFLSLVIPQLVIMVMLILGGLYAIFGLAAGWRADIAGVAINLVWAAYDIFMLSVIVQAAVYRPPTEQPDLKELLAVYVGR